jgi:nitrite reductase/ring-hydroxylating ferredoxin subunit
LAERKNAVDDSVSLPSITPDRGEWDQSAIGRRQFLKVSFWTVTGAAGLIISGLGTRFLVGNSFAERLEQWVDLGPISELPAGQMHRLVYTKRSRDMWREFEHTGLLYAFSQDGLEYMVLDATCSHLGCNVHWKQEESLFACPCHNGQFDRDGRVISGPPPRPLRRLSSKIENGKLIVLI